MERSAAEAAAASAAPSYKEVTSFAALPVGDCTLQLCDLSDDYIQGAVDKPAQVNSCSIKSGALAPNEIGLSVLCRYRMANQWM